MFLFSLCFCFALFNGLACFFRVDGLENDVYVKVIRESIIRTRAIELRFGQAHNIRGCIPGMKRGTKHGNTLLARRQMAAAKQNVALNYLIQLEADLTVRGTTKGQFLGRLLEME